MVTMTYNRPFLYKKQERAFFNAARYKCIEASTKAGKSVGALIWLFEQAIQCQNKWAYWFIAPVYSQAKIMYRRIVAMLEKQIPFYKSDTELRILLPNKASIFFKSGEKPDSLYGEDVGAAVMDEASRQKYESYVAVRSTLTATKGDLVMIGNVRGKKNWFYRLCRKAETGESRNYAYSKITAYDAVEGGVLDSEEIEDARENLPKEVFDELYLAIATDDGSNPFGITNIENCIVEKFSNKPTFAFGADLARKVDWTVITGIDSDGNLTYLDRYQKSWPETTSNLIGLPAGHLLLDSTGVGDPILQSVQQKRGHTEGFLFTSRSKQQLMENLQLAIAAQSVKFIDGVIVDELKNMEYTYSRTGVSYSAPEGLHDDAVCSIGLALLKKDQRLNKKVLIGRAA
jgi:hypothetical protein